MKFPQLKVVVDVVKAFLHNEMELYEDFLILIVLSLMITVVGVKVVTTTHISRLKRELNVLEGEKQESLNHLKQAENEHLVASANLNMLMNTKSKLIKRIDVAKKKIEEHEKEKATRQRNAGRKVVM